MQVTVLDLDAGIVVITVSAVTLPLNQAYSLVIQGTNTTRSPSLSSASFLP